MDDATELTQVWAEVERRLPPGWELDGLRCASTGLAPGSRSDDWVAVARGPRDEIREFRAGQPEEALRGLATLFAPGASR